MSKRMEKTLRRWRRAAGTEVARSPRAFKAHWFGTFCVEHDWAHFSGRTGQDAPWSHEAVLIALGLAATTLRWEDAARDIDRAAGLIVPSACRYQLSQTQPFVELLFVASLSLVGHALDDWCEGAPRPITRLQVRRIHAICAPSRDGGVLGLLDAGTSRTPPSIALRPGAGKHWERHRIAARAMSRGAELEDAAAVAGFPDANTLIRAFRRAFGDPALLGLLARWRQGH